MVRPKFLGIRVLLAPRGMLGHGALAIKKKKKEAFLILANALGLYDGIDWHAQHLKKKKKSNVIFQPNVAWRPTCL